MTKQEAKDNEFGMETIDGELCPFCNNKTLTLTETSRDIPFFGVCHIFSMDCSSCKYHKADVEAEANVYWLGMSEGEKHARLTRVPPWEVVRMMLDGFTELFT